MHTALRCSLQHAHTPHKGVCTQGFVTRIKSAMWAHKSDLVDSDSKPFARFTITISETTSLRIGLLASALCSSKIVPLSLVWSGFVPAGDLLPKLQGVCFNGYLAGAKGSSYLVRYRRLSSSDSTTLVQWPMHVLINSAVLRQKHQPTILGKLVMAGSSLASWGPITMLRDSMPSPQCQSTQFLFARPLRDRNVSEGFKASQKTHVARSI